MSLSIRLLASEGTPIQELPSLIAWLETVEVRSL